MTCEHAITDEVLLRLAVICQVDEDGHCPVCQAKVVREVRDSYISWECETSDWLAVVEMGTYNDMMQAMRR